MADTYLSLRVHLVWATKNRRPWLDPEWRPRLYACASAVISRRSGELLCAGGMRDHIHLYLEPPSTLSLAELVTSIKTTTSKWIHDTFPEQAHFAWQEKYGAFSVSVSQIEAVTKYIHKQPEHHRTTTFADEFLALLKKHQIVYDEKYLWT